MIVSETQVTRQDEPGGGGAIGPLAALSKIAPFEAAASSNRLGWVGLETARFRAAPASELKTPPFAHHWLILVTRPPEQLDLLYEGVKRHVPPLAESLANVLAVHLIRHVVAPRRSGRGRDGTMPRGKLRAVVEYIQEHLDASLTLEQMAAVARLSSYHFARQFKAATGLPPHQYVIACRVERAKQLLQAGGDLSLAQIAARAGFSDQSQFSRHFKRLVGVTPGQFHAPDPS